MTKASKKRVMNVPVDAIWETITDYKRYPKLVPSLKSIKVLEKKDNKTRANYKVSIIKTVSYVLEHTETPKKKMTWKMVEGSFFKCNEGSWTLKPMGKNKVEVVYSIKIGFPLFVGKSIVQGLVEKSLPDMLDNFENHAKKIAKK